MLNTPTVLPGGGLAVSGSINTTPNTLVSIAFYTSPTGDGEGQTLQDVLDVTTDASGNATFAVVLSGAGANDFVTATATSIVFASDSAL